MKKILVTMLALILAAALFAPAVLADPDNKPENDKGKNSEQWQEKKDEQQAKKDEVKERIQERKEAREELMAAFRERMMERAELRIATKEELRAQRQLVLEYKLQLKELKASLEGLTDEERAEYAEEIGALMLQIRDAQKNQLEIIRAYHNEIKDIFPGVRTGQAPTEEDVDEVVEEVLGDI